MTILFCSAVLLILGLYFDGARCGDEVLWLANIALMGCAFIYTGILLRLAYNKYLASCRRCYVALLLVTAFVISVVSYRYNFTDGGYMAMVAGTYGTWYWFVLSAVSGFVSVLLLSTFLSARGRGKIKFLCYLGQNSMVIMMFHSLFINTGKKIFLEMPPTALFGTIFCIAMCVPCIELVNRYVPSLTGHTQRSEKWFVLKQ